ncbi:hypothetical protein HY624_03690 [Candidatus Uhrbacteria bacterium]|nr:hypothetical protein [Candidatus Uhrbacteria bacterium]
MSKRIERIRVFLGRLREHVPRRLDDSYTWAFWSAAATSLYLMLSVAAEALQVTIDGNPHKVGKPIMWVNAIILIAYVAIKEIHRATAEDFHSTKIGRFFVGLWWLETAIIAVLADLYPTRYLFPEDLVDIFITVVGVLVLGDLSKGLIEGHQRKTKKK